MRDGFQELHAIEMGECHKGYNTLKFILIGMLLTNRGCMYGEKRDKAQHREGGLQCEEGHQGRQGLGKSAFSSRIRP